MTKDYEIKERRKALLEYLRSHFKPNHYITIEELCANITIYEFAPSLDTGAMIIKDMKHPYKLNTNPYTHDKCVLLGQDINAIDWDTTSGEHEIIIRDSKGSVKLCESHQEFIEWKEKQMRPLVRKYQFLSTLKFKDSQDGAAPIFEFNNGNVVNNTEEIKVYPKGE